MCRGWTASSFRSPTSGKTRPAEYLIASIAVQEGPELTPENTIVACSTPAVIALFEALGFGSCRSSSTRTCSARGRARDARRRSGDARCTPRAPSCGTATGCWTRSRRAHADPLLTDEGELTETRDYNTYARAFDTGAACMGAAARGRAAGADRRRRLRRRLAAARIAGDTAFAESDMGWDRGRPPALRRARAPARPGRVREPEHVLLPAHDRPGGLFRPPASTRR